LRELVKDKKLTGEKPVFTLAVKSSTTVQMESKRCSRKPYNPIKEESLKKNMNQKVAV